MNRPQPSGLIARLFHVGKHRAPKPPVRLTESGERLDSAINEFYEGRAREFERRAAQAAAIGDDRAESRALMAAAAERRHLK